MNKAKNFFNEFPRNIKRGEKGAVIFTCFIGLLVVVCLFAAVVFVPKLFSTQAANAGGDETDSSTVDKELRYDYTLIAEPYTDETTQTSTQTPTEAVSQTEVPVNLEEALKEPVQYEKSFENNPEDGGGVKPQPEETPPIIIPPVEPPPVVEPEVPPDGTKSYNYFATQALNGFQILNNVKYYFANGSTLSPGIHSIENLRYSINDYGAVVSRAGIDISEHNKTVNFSVAKNYGIDYAILRLGYRGYTKGGLFSDAYFLTNAKSAQNNGIPIGIYFFSQAINAAEGAEEARFCLQYLHNNGISLQYPIYIDSEYSNPDKDGRADTISVADRTAAVKAFCDTINNAGYQAGIYASSYWFRDTLNFSQLKNYEIWIANYNTDVTSPNISGLNSAWKMWQYSSSLVIPNLQTGIKTVDINVCLHDYANGSNMSDLGQENILLKTQAEADVYLDAEQWVTKAETSRTAADYNTALAKVNALFQVRVKNSLLARLDKIQIVADVATDKA